MEGNPVLLKRPFDSNDKLAADGDGQGSGNDQAVPMAFGEHFAGSHITSLSIVHMHMMAVYGFIAGALEDEFLGNA